MSAVWSISRHFSMAVSRPTAIVSNFNPADDTPEDDLSEVEWRCDKVGVTLKRTFSDPNLLKMMAKLARMICRQGWATHVVSEKARNTLPIQPKIQLFKPTAVS